MTRHLGWLLLLLAPAGLMAQGAHSSSADVGSLDSSVASSALLQSSAGEALPQVEAKLPAPNRELADASPGDDICYKIRAYIFKLNDDHAPQYVGHTTCQPRPTTTHNAAWPKARLVPLK